MGAFFTNVQVLSARSAADAVTVLRAHFEARGMRLAAEGEAADRTILVDARDGWISIYDEESEGQNDAVLGDLARAVSQGLDALAFTVLVHDSDVLLLQLFDRGDQADAFDSNPAFSGKRAKEPKADRWTPFLLKGRTAEALRAVWSGERLFAEETLAQTAALFGLDQDRVAVGWNYADQEDAKYTRLALRSLARPATEARAEGPPRLELQSYGEHIEASQGMDLRLGIGARNEGGASRGLSVVVGGDAVARSMLDVKTAEVVIGVPQRAVRIERPFERRGDAFVAVFDEADIPPGLAGGLASLAGLSSLRMVDAMYSACVHTNIMAAGGKPGMASLVIGIVPHGAEEGAAFHESQLDVRATPRRPLRAKPDVDAHALRAIDDGGWLFAQVSLDCDRATAAEAAAPIFESWAPHLRGQLSIGVHRSDPGARPRVGSAKADGFFTSRSWKKVCGELATERSVEVHSDTAGFVFGTHLISHDVVDPELPTLAVWLDTKKLDDEQLAAARAALERAVDGLGDRVVQAMLTRWASSWPPRLDSTAYELACDVHGQCTMYESWLTRWLRGVGKGVLWIGCDLASHVDRDALARVARVEDRAGLLRVTIDENLEEVERALAPILPAHDDWRRGVDGLYGRGTP